VKPLGRRGFSLVELVVLLAVLGLLATIAQPNFADAQDRARNAAMAANVRQTGVALEQYASERRGRYPASIVEPAFLNGHYLPGDHLPIAPWYQRPQVEAVQYAAPYDFDPDDWPFILYAASMGGGPQGWLHDAELADPPSRNTHVGVLRYNYYPDANAYQLFGQGRIQDERVILMPTTNKGS
jgi:prepilin-type N-terminal cleavage/methylation domain-containing protein